MEPLWVFQAIVAWIARSTIPKDTVRGIMAPVVPAGGHDIPEPRLALYDDTGTHQ
jgi:hypothetical protein